MMAFEDLLLGVFFLIFLVVVIAAFVSLSKDDVWK